MPPSQSQRRSSIGDSVGMDDGKVLVDREGLLKLMTKVKILERMNEVYEETPEIMNALCGQTEMLRSYLDSEQGLPEPVSYGVDYAIARARSFLNELVDAERAQLDALRGLLDGQVHQDSSEHGSDRR